MRIRQFLLVCIALLGGIFSIALVGAASSSGGRISPLDNHIRNYLPYIAKGPALQPTLTPTPTLTATPTSTPGVDPTLPPPDAFVVDHRSVDDFEQIPDQYIDVAAAIDMLFIDRSVGQNISEGLGCLSHPTDEEAPNNCSRYEHIEPAFSVDPSEVNWSRPGGYPRDNWDYLPWETGCGTWSDKVKCFFDIVDRDGDQYDVVSYQFSYLEVGEGSTIANQPGGFFWDNPDLYDVYDLEGYEDAHPDKIFIYWTTSLARNTGSLESEAFNNQMREYAVANGKILFDVADILSRDPEGNPCYDNRDGVPYNNGNNEENHPDDGQNIPAICPHYTTETDGGHLGAVSAGKIRVAKAFWVLMARIAGWEGSTN